MGRQWRSDGQAFAVSAAAGCRALFPRSRHRLLQHAPDAGRQALQLRPVFDLGCQLLSCETGVFGPHFANLPGQLNVRTAPTAVSCLRKVFAGPVALRAPQHRCRCIRRLFRNRRGARTVSSRCAKHRMANPVRLNLFDRGADFLSQAKAQKLAHPSDHRGPADATSQGNRAVAHPDGPVRPTRLRRQSVKHELRDRR